MGVIPRRIFMSPRALSTHQISLKLHKTYVLYISAKNNQSSALLLSITSAEHLATISLTTCKIYVEGFSLFTYLLTYLFTSSFIRT